jgi:hypothetical protein
VSREQTELLFGKVDSTELLFEKYDIRILAQIEGMNLSKEK